MKRQSMKSKILDFVESQGTARRMEIVKFIVDHNHGEGSYDKQKSVPQKLYVWDETLRDHVLKTFKMNRWRGYYSVAFNAGGGELFGSHIGYLLRPSTADSGMLAKQTDGSYKTIR